MENRKQHWLQQQYLKAIEEAGNQPKEIRISNE
jgi:hypothetical protein